MKKAHVVMWHKKSTCGDVALKKHMWWCGRGLAQAVLDARVHSCACILEIALKHPQPSCATSLTWHHPQALSSASKHLAIKHHTIKHHHAPSCTIK